jgi:hypothetical protein
MDLSEKRKSTMFPTAVQDMPEEKIHKEFSLPLKLLGGLKFKKGDKICVELTGTITEIHDAEYMSEFRMTAEEGEVESEHDEVEEDEEGGTYLGKEE